MERIHHRVVFPSSLVGDREATVVVLLALRMLELLLHQYSFSLWVHVIILRELVLCFSYKEFFSDCHFFFFKVSGYSHIEYPGWRQIQNPLAVGSKYWD